jgi:Predicted phosphosugar isomerases
MFTKTDQELEKMGAKITTREIQQQPDLWQEAFQNYTNKKSEIDSFLDKVTSTYPNQKSELSSLVLELQPM